MSEIYKVSSSNNLTETTQIQVDGSSPPNINIIKTNPDFANSVTVINTLLGVISIVVGVVNYLKLLKQPLKDVAAFIDPREIRKRKIIETLMMRMLLRAEADRMVIGMFMNGNTISEISLKKFSIVYEVKRNSSIQSIKPVYQQIDSDPILTEVVYCSDLYFTVFQRDNPEIKPGCAKYMDYNNLKTVLNRLLTTKDGIYGVVQFQYLEPADTKKITENVLLEEKFNKLEKALKYIREGKDKQLDILATEFI